MLNFTPRLPIPVFRTPQCQTTTLTDCIVLQKLFRKETLNHITLSRYDTENMSTSPEFGFRQNFSVNNLSFN